MSSSTPSTTSRKRKLSPGPASGAPLADAYAALATTLGFKQAGASVNLETDLFAKYVLNYLANVGIESAAGQRER